MLGGYRPTCPKCGAELEPIADRDRTYHCTACEWPYWVRVTSESGGRIALETIEPEEEEG